MEMANKIIITEHIILVHLRIIYIVVMANYFNQMVRFILEIFKMD